MQDGVSICVVSYNTYFFTRLCVEKVREHTHLIPYEILVYDNGSTDGSLEWLDAQADVRLFKGMDNSVRHGKALDFLSSMADIGIICTLCSDAHPVSPEWIGLALRLYKDDVTIAGICKDWGRILEKYVCPSYLFARTDWLKRHSFEHNWPQWDTGEKLCLDAVEEGGRLSFVEYCREDFGGRFAPHACDYSGLVWHTWFSSRRSIPGVVGGEVELGYHDYVQQMLRGKYRLDY